MTALRGIDVGQSEWWKELREKGIIPPQVTRMIIDISMQNPVRVYYETLAEPSMLGGLPNILKGADFIDVGEIIKASSNAET